jgi:hypothetical protein
MDYEVPLRFRVAYHYLLNDTWEYVRSANKAGKYAVCWTYLNNLCFTLGGLGSTTEEAKECVQFLYKIGALGFGSPPVLEVSDPAILLDIATKAQTSVFIYYRSVLRSVSTIHFDDVIYEFTDRFVQRHNLLGVMAELERRYRGY